MAGSAAARVDSRQSIYEYGRPERMPIYNMPVQEAYANDVVIRPVPRPVRMPGEISKTLFRNIFACIVLITILSITYIFLAAQEAVIQKEINDLNYQIVQTNDDINATAVGIEQGQNIRLVEQKAKDELGMRDPSIEQSVFVSEINVPEDGVAQMIRDAAYGSAG